MRFIATTAVLTTLIVFFLFTSNSELATSIRSMASRPQEAQDPHVSKSMITLELKVQDPTTSPPTIIATITNLHGSTAVTLLTWDTPFDDKALLLGLFTIKDIKHGYVIPSPGLKINRVLPPPKDAFMEVGPRHAVAKQIVLEGPSAQLEKGLEYEIQAKGRWKAVWHASVADIGIGNLQKMGGGTGVLAFDFESNAITVKA